MSLELYEKQLLRSISDLVVHNPQGACDLFEHVGDTPIIHKIDNIKNFVTSCDQFERRERYFSDLKEAVSQIDDKDVKKIFNSSLDASELYTLD